MNHEMIRMPDPVSAGSEEDVKKVRLNESYPGVPLGFDVNCIKRHMFPIIEFNPKSLDLAIKLLADETGHDEQAITGAVQGQDNATVAVGEYNRLAILADEVLGRRVAAKETEIPIIRDQLANEQDKLLKLESDESNLVQTFTKLCAQAKIIVGQDVSQASFEDAVYSVAVKDHKRMSIPKSRDAGKVWNILVWLLTLLAAIPVGIAFAVTLHAVRVSGLRAHFLTPLTVGFMLGGFLLLSILNFIWGQIAREVAEKKPFIHRLSMLLVGCVLLLCTMSAETYAIWQYNSAREAVMRLSNPNIIAVPVWAYAFLGMLGAFSVAFKYYIEKLKTEEAQAIASAEKFNADQETLEERMAKEYVENRAPARDAQSYLARIGEIRFSAKPENKQRLQTLYDDLKLLGSADLQPEEEIRLRDLQSKALDSVAAAKKAAHT